jgi:hypothetical protein
VRINRWAVRQRTPGVALKYKRLGPTTVPITRDPHRCGRVCAELGVASSNSAAIKATPNTDAELDGMENIDSSLSTY